MLVMWSGFHVTSWFFSRIFLLKDKTEKIQKEVITIEMYSNLLSSPPLRFITCFNFFPDLETWVTVFCLHSTGTGFPSKPEEHASTQAV